MPMPTRDGQLENQTLPMEDNSNRPGSSNDIGVTNHSPSIANHMNINIASPEVIRPYPKA